MQTLTLSRTWSTPSAPLVAAPSRKVSRNTNDVVLLQLIAKGREDALEALYDQYGRLIFSIVLRVVGDKETAEEITLDIFTKVWQKAHSYREDRAKVTTWLTRMARNRAIDILRRRSVRPEQHSIAWANITREPASAENPEHTVHFRLQRGRVIKAMDKLSAEQHEALTLAYFKGFTHTEIASHLNIPLGTIKSRIRSGMAILRGILRE